MYVYQYLLAVVVVAAVIVVDLTNNDAFIQHDPFEKNFRTQCYIDNIHPSSASQVQQIRWRRNPDNIDITRWNGEIFVRETKHPETQEYPGMFSGEPVAKGRVYDRKPFRMQVEAGKTYLWCSCGLSKSQVCFLIPWSHCTNHILCSRTFYY